MNAKEIPFGKIKEGKIILNAWGEYPEREIGEIRDDDMDSSIQYFISKYEDLVKKIEELEAEINSSENKGSFLMKLVHMKDQLSTHDGLGDYQALHDRLQKQESLLSDIIQKNRERNSEIKAALLEEVKQANQKINWREATEEIHDIKNRWIKTGNAKEEENEKLDEEFWEIVKTFFEKKKQFYEDKKRLGEKHKKEYEALVKKAEKAASLQGAERIELIKSLKSAWSEVGNIPKEEYIPLQKAFNNNLKPGKAAPGINLGELLLDLEAFLNGSKPYEYKNLDGYRKELKMYKPQNNEEKKEKHEAFQKLQMLLEKDFIDKLARKRFRDFKELDKSKRYSIRIGILEELIERDKADLNKFQENSANFSGGTAGALDLIEKKLNQQRNKIETKEALLKLLKADN